MNKRKYWKIPGRTDAWWNNLITAKMPADEWIKNIRMEFNTFMKLTDLLREYVTPNAEAFRPDTISAEKRVAIVLYYLKDQGSFRMTANTFGVSLATVSCSLRIVCNAICKRLGPLFINFPSTKEEIKEASARFESKFGIPQAIGCVDGTHVAILQPSDNPHDYFCYKMKYSLNCQAICDEKGIFVDVEVRWPGSVHDARVYANCNINKKFVSKEIASVKQELVPGYAPVPPFLLGDPAYPLLPNVMKEHSKCTNDKETTFNNRLRSARNQIECAFGRLKARWRILNRTLDVDLEFASTLIYSCFVLHNFCEINNVEIYHEAVVHQIDQERRTQCCQHHDKIDKLYSYNSSHGKRIRDALTEYIYEKTL